jgi:hypothetical protein
MLWDSRPFLKLSEKYGFEKNQTLTRPIVDVFIVRARILARRISGMIPRLKPEASAFVPGFEDNSAKIEKKSGISE